MIFRKAIFGLAFVALALSVKTANAVTLETVYTFSLSAELGALGNFSGTIDVNPSRSSVYANIGGSGLQETIPAIYGSGFLFNGQPWSGPAYQLPVLDQIAVIFNSSSLAQGQVNAIEFWISLSTLNLSMSYFSQGISVPIPLSTFSVSDQLAAPGDPGSTFSVIGGSGFLTPSGSFEMAPTPLPSTLSLFVGGLAALAVFGWRKKRKLMAANRAFNFVALPY